MIPTGRMRVAQNHYHTRIRSVVNYRSECKIHVSDLPKIVALSQSTGILPQSWIEDLLEVGGRQSEES